MTRSKQIELCFENSIQCVFTLLIFDLFFSTEKYLEINLCLIWKYFISKNKCRFTVSFQYNFISCTLVEKYFRVMLFQQYFSYIVAVSSISRGNRSTRRKQPICRKSLTNFITLCRVHFVMSVIRTHNFIGVMYWLQWKL